MVLCASEVLRGISLIAISRLRCVSQPDQTSEKPPSPIFSASRYAPTIASGFRFSFSGTDHYLHVSQDAEPPFRLSHQWIVTRHRKDKFDFQVGEHDLAP